MKPGAVPNRNWAVRRAVPLVSKPTSKCAPTSLLCAKASSSPASGIANARKPPLRPSFANSPSSSAKNRPHAMRKHATSRRLRNNCWHAADLPDHPHDERPRKCRNHRGRQNAPVSFPGPRPTGLVSPCARFPASGRGAIEGVPNIASRECYAPAFKRRWAGGAVSQSTVGVIRACGNRSAEGVDIHLDVIGNFRTAGKLMRGAIRDDLDPLAFDSLAVRDPNALPSLSLLRESPASGLACCIVRTKVAPDFFMEVPFG